MAHEGMDRMLQPRQQSIEQSGGRDSDSSKVLMEPVLQYDLGPCLWPCGLWGCFSALPRDSLSCSMGPLGYFRDIVLSFFSA